MATTLLDKLRKQMGSSREKAKFTGEGARTADLLRARTGKAVSASGPAASSLAEKAAVDATGQQLDQISLGASTAAESIGIQDRAQRDQADNALQSAQLQARGQREQSQRQEENILADFEQGRRRLDNARDIAELEQVGFRARMENAEYLDNLRRQGELSRARGSTTFNEDLQRSVFSDMEDLVGNGLEFNEMMAASDSEFNKMMADMDINYAVQLASQERKDAATRAQYEAAGQVFSAGANYYANNPADTTPDIKPSSTKVISGPRSPRTRSTYTA